MTSGPDSLDPGLEAAIDRLYGLPLAEFVAQRNQLAAQHKADKPVHAVVSKLAKPSVVAWAINQVYWRQRRHYDELVAAAAAVVAAQADGDSGQLRAAMAERRRALDAATAAAEAALIDAGHGATLDTLRRIGRSLEALATWGSHDDAPRAGRLVGEVEPPGLELLAALAAGAPGPRRQSPARASRSTEAVRAQAAREAVVERAEAELRVRSLEATRACEERDRLIGRAAELERKVAEAADRLAELEQRLAAAQREARDGKAAARRASAAETRARKQLERVSRADD